MSCCQTSTSPDAVDFVQSEVATDVTQLPGLQQLWAETLGDPRICIAVLDGPVDLNHPSIRDAALTQIELDEVIDSAAIRLSDHGTHVTSIIFGSHDGPVKGIAPHCRGLIIPIFRYAADGSLEACSQERLAKAIRAAVRFGANVINISAGQFSQRGEARPELRAAIEACGEDVLIVSAAGNDGCDCLHVPGALPSVLAVGAMGREGHPLEFSNWGAAYQEQGILAPGERILGAAGDGGVRVQTGTSFSTPIVSGVAGLLLSLQQKLGIVPSSKSIRHAILETTQGCDPQTETQCERVLAGRLNISGSASLVTQGPNIMENATNSPTPVDASVLPSEPNTPAAQPSAGPVEASACCGGCAGESREFVYAIGELGYDFPSILREASVQQHMESVAAVPMHIPQARNSLDFVRHLFGFKEIFISERNIGDIKKIETTSAIYRLSLRPATATGAIESSNFELKYSGQSKSFSANESAKKIRDALAELPGLTYVDSDETKHYYVEVAEVEPTQPTDYPRELIISVMRPLATTGGELELGADESHIANVKLDQVKGMRVEIFGHRLLPDDIGRHIGFSGVSLGEGPTAESSELNSCNNMVIRGIEPPSAGDKAEPAPGQTAFDQVLYIETDVECKPPSELHLAEAHFHIPQAYEVTQVHEPHTYDASAVIWKLNRGQMEVYGIVPEGTFSTAAYEELGKFYMNACGLTEEGLNYYYYQKAGRFLPWEFDWDPRFNADPCREAENSGRLPQPLTQERSERVAIPGVVQGEVQLITGVRLPAIKPDMRGTAEWSQAEMLKELLAAVRQSTGAKMSPEEKEIVSQKIQTVLERLDDEVRNPGLCPEHRALNHAATHLFGAIGAVAAELVHKKEATTTGLAKTYELDDIAVKHSEIGYAGSDCWDVEVSFFNPENHLEARLVVVQTIDVNDTIPALTDKPRKFRRR